MKKGRRIAPPALPISQNAQPDLEVHSAHSAHAAAGHRRSRLVFRSVGNRSLGGDQEPGDARRILKRRANDLGRVDHAGLDQVLVLLGLSIEAERRIVAIDQLAGDDRSVMTRVLRDLPKRRLKRLADDVDAAGLIVVLALQAVERPGRVQQRSATARDDALFDRSAGRMKRVVDAVLALLDLDLGRTADLDHSNTAGELRETLLELLTVIVGRGRVDLLTDRADTTLDILAGAVTVDDRRIVLVDRDALGLAEHVQRDALELDAEIFADHFTAGEDRDVLEHCLA